MERFDRSGSFVTPPHVESRSPRPPIAALTFLADQTKATTGVVSVPKADNGIVAALPARSVEELLEALDLARLIVVDITYDFAQRESPKLRARGGTSGEHGRNAPMKECFAILTPALEAEPLIQIPNAGSQTARFSPRNGSVSASMMTWSRRHSGGSI